MSVQSTCQVTAPGITGVAAERARPGATRAIRLRRGRRRRTALTVGVGLAIAICVGFVVPVGAIGRDDLQPAFLSAYARALSLTRPGEIVLVRARVENSMSCELTVVHPNSAHSQNGWRPCADGRFTERVRFGPDLDSSSDFAELRLLARSGPGDIAARILTVNLGAHHADRIGSSRVSAASDDVSAVALPLSQQQSTDWAGYVATPDAPVTSVSATWTVPSATCGTETTWLGSWLGVDGAEAQGPGTKLLFQVGVYSYCVDGEQQNEAWWEAYPGPANALGTVHTGDSISASVVRTNGGWTWSVADTTTGASYQSGQPVGYSGPAGTADWIVEDPGIPSEPFVLSFSPITFTNMGSSTAEGTSLTGGSTWQMVQSGQVLASPNQRAAAIASHHTMTVRFGGKPF